MDIKLLNKKKNIEETDLVKCILINSIKNDSFEIELTYIEYKFKKDAFKLFKKIPKEIQEEYLELLEIIKQAYFRSENLVKFNDEDYWEDEDGIDIPEFTKFIKKIEDLKLNVKLQINIIELLQYCRYIYFQLATNQYN